MAPPSYRLAINRPPVADRLTTGRRFLGIVVADQSPIDLQLKNAVLIAQWLRWLQMFFSRKAVADRLQYMCDRGFTEVAKKGGVASHSSRILIHICILMRLASSQIAVHRTRRPPDSSREDRPGSKRRPGLSRFAVAQYFLGTTNTLRAHEMNLD